jgi:diadenosine tetraphosphatase ApaH/serine/threonine PP2A family protein phosphatase
MRLGYRMGEAGSAIGACDGAHGWVKSSSAQGQSNIMRYAIFSDVHGNLDALQAVFQDIDYVARRTGRRMDQIWCLGDVVGYGPQPGECVNRVRGRCDICIPGNHDWAAVQKLDLADFSEAAAESARWTRDRLSDADWNYLHSLPDSTTVGNFTLAHGSPSQPIWEYLTTPDSAAWNFPYFDTLFCVVGHTHLPTIFLQPIMDHVTPLRAATRALDRKLALAMATPGGPTRSSLESGELSATTNRNPAIAPCERWQPTPGLWRLPRGYRAIINPGSVGQPRDGDPRASYLVYDSDEGFEFRRVPYNIAETQRKIQMYGLPARLAERLATGS